MLLPFSLGLKKDNTLIKFRNMTDYEFKQWLVGFIDGEGCFRIAINNKNKVISFNLTIGLHVDDLEALEFIRNRLKCGNVFIDKGVTTFHLTKINDIQNILIPLLDEFPLNGVKYLDYLAFKQAINIKLDSLVKQSDKLELITQIKNRMNTRRVDFTMSSSHTIRITPYWLLGFIEGEGSFFFNYTNMGVGFSITLTSSQAPLINAIKNFLDSYLIEDVHLKASPVYKEIISQRTSLHTKKKSTENANTAIILQLKRVNFILDKFIPLLSNLSFVTKKYQDFLDF
jgi:hypothetical protein